MKPRQTRRELPGAVVPAVYIKVKKLKIVTNQQKDLAVLEYSKDSSPSSNVGFGSCVGRTAAQPG